MKKALVCGAGGFIGSHLVKELKQRGYWVRGADLQKVKVPLEAVKGVIFDRPAQPAGFARLLETESGAVESGKPIVGIRTATHAFNNAAWLYIQAVARLGVDVALQTDPALAHGVNTRNGQIINPALQTGGVR